MNRKTILILFILILPIWYSYEVFYAREQMALLGVPKADSFDIFVRVLRNDGFMLGYSEFRKNPLWVTYKITNTSNSKSLKRPSKFEIDSRTISRISHKDYTNTGYDRGHLAPNSVISKVYGKSAQLDTFLMTNISPQIPSFNRSIWKNLETVAKKNLPSLNNEIWVITGPIFSGESLYLGSSYIVIPSAFYKIFAMQKNAKIYMLGFIIPQSAPRNDSLRKYMVSIDKIEKATGLDFFYKLNDNVENLVESKIDLRNWDIKKFK